MSEPNKKEGSELKESIELKEVLNTAPTVRLSKSLYEIASKSPAATISSIAALFIVIILSIVIPTLFSPCKSS